MTAHRVPAGVTPMPLEKYLRRAWPMLPGHVIRGALKRRDVRVNGARSGADAVVRGGDELTLYLDEALLMPEADVLWAGIRPCEELDHLAERVRHVLADAGIPFDRKRFNPHITLARKPSVPRDVVLSEFPVPAVSMIVYEVCLYRSDRGKSGMVYTVIGSSGGREDDP